MTLFRVSIITLIVVIGCAHSLPLLQIAEKEHEEYRPWEDNDDNSTTWISLEGMGIQSLTSMFRLNIPNLKWLVLDNNRIDTIPSEAFENFPDVTYISLRSNQIRQIESDAFVHLQKLEVLDLDLNPLTAYQGIDSSVFNTLSTLKRLYLRVCGLSSFNIPSHMDNLSCLDLTGNRLELFYTANETKLTSLYLNDNQLSYVSLSQFESLVHLNMSNNQLTKIRRRSDVPPAYFAEHIFHRASEEWGLYMDDPLALKYLIIPSNQLSNIASDAFEDAKELVHVDLTANQIEDIHGGTFNDLQHLEDILLDSNKISEINHRAFVNLPNLKIISLKNNLINYMNGDAFTNLNSNANEIQLFLDNNRIDTLRRGSFMGIKGLKHIGLSNNRIQTISSQTFVNLPNLDSIVIENQLPDQNSDDRPYHEIARPFAGAKKGFIETDAFFNLTNITSITISGNLFTNIEAKAFHSLPKLTSLDLSKNSIDRLSSEAFYDLPKIEDLSLADNAICSIGQDTFPKQLKRLNLARTRVCSEFSCLQVAELDQLEELDVSGVVEQFKIADFAQFRDNLTVIVASTHTVGDLHPPCLSHDLWDSWIIDNNDDPVV